MFIFSLDRRLSLLSFSFKSRTKLSCSPHTTCWSSSPRRPPVKYPWLPATSGRHSAASAPRTELAVATCAGVHPNMRHLPRRAWRSLYQRLGGSGAEEAGASSPPAFRDEYARPAPASLGTMLVLVLLLFLLRAAGTAGAVGAGAPRRLESGAARGRSFARDGILVGEVVDRKNTHKKKNTKTTLVESNGVACRRANRKDPSAMRGMGIRAVCTPALLTDKIGQAMSSRCLRTPS